MVDEENEVTNLVATGTSFGLLEEEELNSPLATQTEDVSGKNGSGEERNDVPLVPENATPEVGEERSDEVAFLKHLLTAQGSTQVLFALLLMAMSQGSTVGVVPAILSDRYARLYYGYQGEPCYRFGAHDLLPQECKDGSNAAQGAAALSSLARSLFSFATSSLMGSISDGRGRRDLLIASLVLAALAPIAMVGIVTISSLSPWVYYTMDATRGIVYGLPLFLSSLSDVTPAKWKTGSFGAVTAVYALGYAFAPLFAVALEYRTVCVTSLMFMMLALLFAVCYLPETLPDASRSQSTQTAEEDEGDISVCRQIAAALYRPIDELCIVRRSHLFVLLSFLSIFAGMNLSADSTFTIYYIENQMHFNDEDVSIFFIVLGAVSLFTQGILLAPLTARIGEKMVMIVGFSLSALHSFLYGFARNKATIFMAAAAAGVAGMALPTIGSVMANNVSSSEQGRIQGALYSLSSLAQGLGPIFLQSIYNYVKDTQYPGPGGMFIAAGLLQVVSIIISCLLPKDKTDYAKRTTQTQRGPSNILTQALLEDKDEGESARGGQVV